MHSNIHANNFTDVVDYVLFLFEQFTLCTYFIPLKHKLINETVILQLHSFSHKVPIEGQVCVSTGQASERVPIPKTPQQVVFTHAHIKECNIHANTAIEK